MGVDKKHFSQLTENLILANEKLGTKRSRIPPS